MNPNTKKIELCLTYRCNVHCNNCSNLCTQAPCNWGDLSVDAISAFIDDATTTGHRFELITLHGGEPVLHPEIKKISRMLAIYKGKHSTGTRISLLTNWSTPKIQKLSASICHEYGFELGKSQKISSNKRDNGEWIPYVAVNESPIDANLPHSEGCFQTTDCGICLNYLGYFECSPAAAAARVFGYEPIAKNISEFDKLSSGFKLHCGHCGFATIGRDRVTDQVTSKTWETAFEKYKAEGRNK